MLTWDPPRELVLSWAISAHWQPDPDLASEVAATFEPAGEGTRVVVEHRHLDRAWDGWQQLRDTFAGDHGWSVVLRRYADVVAAG